jgi:GTP-binding protein
MNTRSGMETLLRRVAEHVDPPCDTSAVTEPFAFSVNSLGVDPFIGRLVTGKVYGGIVKPGAKVHIIKRSPDVDDDNDGIAGGGAGGGGAAKPTAPAAVCGGKPTGQVQTVTHVFCIRNGTERVEVSEAQAGDIVVLAGVGNGDAASSSVAVADTVADPSVLVPLPTVPVTPPTICMSFGANDGPLAGRSGGTFLNPSQVKARLEKEVENNVTVVLKPSPTDSDQLEVHARGELQLGILIEEMRREGFELCVSPPRILTRRDRTTGKMLEPVEEVTIDVDTEHAGTVIERLQGLRAPMEEYKEMGEGRVRLIFRVASRLLMGVRAALRNDTHGSAVVNSIFAAYERPEGGGDEEVNDKGRLVATGAQGNATAYALNLIEARGTLFVRPGEEIYEGMVIGENSRPGDLDVNPTKAKKMSNVRSVTADEKINLAPPRQMSLEDYITYMAQDEVLEVTPKAIRLRKRFLDPGMRAKGARSNKKSATKTSKK